VKCYLHFCCYYCSMFMFMFYFNDVVFFHKSMSSFLGDRTLVKVELLPWALHVGGTGGFF